MSLVDENFVADFVAIAKGEVGVRESGRNAGTRIRLYQSTTWLAPGDWPWCAAFVCWCFAEACRLNVAVCPLPATPRAYDFESWGRKWFALAKPAKSVSYGNIVIFDFSHVGIACSASRNGKVWVVEGNTDGSGGRDGDGVYIRRRDLSSIRSIVSLS